jgi:hypothetical protein
MQKQNSNQAKFYDGQIIFLLLNFYSNDNQCNFNFIVNNLVAIRNLIYFVRRISTRFLEKNVIDGRDTNFIDNLLSASD